MDFLCPSLQVIGLRLGEKVSNDQEAMSLEELNIFGVDEMSISRVRRKC